MNWPQLSGVDPLREGQASSTIVSTGSMAPFRTYMDANTGLRVITLSPLQLRIGTGNRFRLDQPCVLADESSGIPNSCQCSWNSMCSSAAYFAASELGQGYGTGTGSWRQVCRRQQQVLFPEDQPWRGTSSVHQFASSASNDSAPSAQDVVVISAVIGYMWTCTRRPLYMMRRNGREMSKRRAETTILKCR